MWGAPDGRVPVAESSGLRLRPLIVAGVTLAVVVITGWAIVANPGWSAAELQVVVAVHSAGTPFFDRLALGIDHLFGAEGGALVAAAVALLAWVGTRQWRVPVRIGVAAGIAWAIAELVKPVVGRVRPDPGAIAGLAVPSPLEYSYPSGHTAFAAALGTAVVIVVFRHRWRMRATAIAAAVALVTAWSRVHLGVHYPTDVIASLVLVPTLVVAADVIVVALLARLAPTRRPQQALSPH